MKNSPSVTEKGGEDAKHQGARATVHASLEIHHLPEGLSSSIQRCRPIGIPS